MGKRILLIEDELKLILMLKDRLRAEGYAVETETNGDAGYERAAGESFDLIILDVMLPGKNGFDICRDLRRQAIETPILMLTARGQVTDRVVGLKLGADDYLIKPFEVIELLARIEVLLRRSFAAEKSEAMKTGDEAANFSDAYQFGAVKVNFRTAELMRGGILIEISAQELRLLRYFVEHRGAAVSRNELLDAVWGYNAMPSTRTVDVHVAALRQKIEENPRHPQHILTLHGLGYKFVG